jgi:DNA replication protein DnaC
MRQALAMIATLAEAGADMLFQVIAGRAEKAAVVITTNLPFSEWTSVFPNARLCKAKRIHARCQLDERTLVDMRRANPD